MPQNRLNRWTEGDGPFRLRKHAGARQAKKGTTEKRSRTKPALRVVPAAAQVQLSLNVPGVLRDVRREFCGLCVNAGKQVLAARMQADQVALCGANNVPGASRKTVRDGTTRSNAVLSGQRIAMDKPQARSLERGESESPTIACAADTDVRRQGQQARLGLRGGSGAFRDMAIPVMQRPSRRSCPRQVAALRSAPPPNAMTKRVLPIEDSTRMLAPWAVAMDRAMARPSPAPSPDFLRDASTW